MQITLLFNPCCNPLAVILLLLFCFMFLLFCDTLHFVHSLTQTQTHTQAQTQRGDKHSRA